MAKAKTLWLRLSPNELKNGRCSFNFLKRAAILFGARFPSLATKSNTWRGWAP
jgi:hypothetical protein